MTLRLAFALLACLLLASAEHWNVTNKDSKLTCLILDADLSFELKYTPENATEPKTFTVPFGKTNSWDGECSATHKSQSVNHLHILFSVGNLTALEASWEIDFWFGKHNETSTFKLVDYQLVAAHSSVFPYDATYTMPEKTEAEVQAKDKDAFKCSETVLALSSDSSMRLSQLNVIAFADLNETTFPKNQMYELCLRDTHTSDVVPIVVGICLAGLVVIVLVAYLIGRARAKRQGYASV